MKVDNLLKFSITRNKLIVPNKKWANVKDVKIKE